MKISYLPAFLIYLISVIPAFAEEMATIEVEPVVITARKIAEPISEAPSSIAVVSREDIRVRQSLKLDEAVRPLSGLTVQTYGGIDPWTNISLRGTDANHSIVMIDGIKVNSPYSQIPNAGAFLLSHVERVEVVKGSYSALYGSEAIGGVVNIITGERPGLTYSISGGTHKTFNSGLLYSGRYSDAAYTLGYERLSTAGFKFSGPFWNNTLLGKIALPLSAASSLQFSTNYWDWKKYDHTICCEIDGSGNFAFILDQDSYTREDNWLNSIQLTHVPAGQWDYQIKLSRYHATSQMNDALDPATAERPFPLEIDSDVRSERDIFEMQHNFYSGENNVTTLGFQYTYEEIRKEEFGNLDSFGMGPSLKQPGLDADRISRAVYLQNLFKIRNVFTFAAGARFENGPGFDSLLVPKVSALYVLPSTETELHFSYGQGIRAPNLHELYHPVGGNPDLSPEKSKSLEAGFRQPLAAGRVWVEATGFTLRLKDLIDWSDDPPDLIFINIGRSRIAGVEAGLHAAVTEKWQTDIGYTRLSTENMDSGKALLFRPHYRWTLDVRYKPVSRLVIDVNAEFAGKAFNSHDFIVGLDGKFLSRTIASYKVVNMAASYNLVKGDPILGSLDFTLKLDNIFGEDYVTLPEFRNYGFTFLAGIRSAF